MNSIPKIWISHIAMQFLVLVYWYSDTELNSILVLCSHRQPKSYQTVKSFMSGKDADLGIDILIAFQSTSNNCCLLQAAWSPSSLKQKLHELLLQQLPFKVS